MKVGDMVKARLGTATGWIVKQHPLYTDACWVKWIDPGADAHRLLFDGEETLVYKDNLELVET